MKPDESTYKSGGEKTNNHKHQTEYWILYKTNLIKGGYINY